MPAPTLRPPSPDPLLPLPPHTPTQADAQPHTPVCTTEPEAEEGQLGGLQWHASGCCHSNMDSTSHTVPSRHRSHLTEQRPERATEKQDC